MANVAALLCKAKRSVLIVDLDLEAPGVHKFFSKLDKSLNDTINKIPGIVDFIHSSIDGKQIDWKDALSK